MAAWAELAEHQLKLSAEILWDILERQANPGVTWDILEAMHPTLRGMVPLVARVHNRWVPDEGIYLKQLVRVYDPAAAQRMLQTIGLDDLPDRLRAHGYDATRRTFLEAACLHARAQQSCTFYTR